MLMADRVAVVTGGEKGIGRYIAQTFAREGARVAIAGIDTDRLPQTERELNDLDTEAIAIQADVREESQVQSMLERVHQRFGRIDVLVNNAAVVTHFMWGGPRWPAVQDMDKAFWDRVIDTALGGTFACTKHVIPYIAAQGGGHIVNLHGGGSTSVPGTAAYAVAKDAILTFTRFVAEEVRDKNIRVSIVSPGAAIATEDAPEEARARMPGPEFAANRFVLASCISMEMSGHLLNLEGDNLVIEC